MTLTAHAISRLDKRNIPYKLIVNCLHNGQIMQAREGYKITDGLITIVTDITKTVIIIAYPSNRIKHKIDRIARKQKISFRQAAKKFFEMA